MEEQTQHRTTSSARLHFVLGKKTVDVALPAEAALADLLPAILPQFGGDLVEQGADHEGWIVQRLGQPPLDEDRTLTELNLLDGETVYFRPRADQLAAIDYDDLVDGVGEQVREHRSAWTPGYSRWMFRLIAALALAFGLWLLPGAGSVRVQALTALSIAVLFLLGSALVARAAADSASATIVAGAAAAYGALGGSLLIGLADPVATVPMRLTGAAAGLIFFLFAGLTAVADAALLFAGAILFTLVVGTAGLIGSTTGLTGAQAAAIGLVVSLVIGVFVPQTAFRLSGLSLPMLPTGADELSEDIEPVPAEVVVERGAAVVAYSMSLHLGLGAAQAVLLPMAVVSHDGWTTTFTLVIAFLLLLRSRHPGGAVQRWAITGPAIVAVAANLVAAANAQSETGRLVAVCVPVLLAGVALLVFGRIVPGRRLRPYWGRVVEILESITAIAVLPLLLQVLDVFMKMRGLAG
ncbi:MULTISPECIES: type VII secretion integral membrane protein EccD [Amycolatopsis]|uniref:Type VII secretion integral membrane protein EccD n=1 Tax=Amycolatopsis albidoflavus TaxID=102226 RepID=A0ABW5HRU2_9PSEU